MLHRVLAFLKALRHEGQFQDREGDIRELDVFIGGVGVDEETAMAELLREIDAQNDTIQLLANGLGSGIDGWKRCALRLRREVLLLDPSNKTESQIDWRLAPEPARIQ